MLLYLLGTAQYATFEGDALRYFCEIRPTMPSFCLTLALNMRHTRRIPPGNPTGAADLHDIAICLVAQCALVFGLAGIFWPEKLSPIFDTLMFPWPSSLRTVRTNSIGALALSALLVLGLLSRILL